MAETPKANLQIRLLLDRYVLVDRSYSMTSKDGNASTRTSACTAVEKLVSTVFKYDIDHNPLYVFDHETTFVGELGDPSDVIQRLQGFGAARVDRYRKSARSRNEVRMQEGQEQFRGRTRYDVYRDFGWIAQR
jgi:hypothetical protein